MLYGRKEDVTGLTYFFHGCFVMRFTNITSFALCDKFSPTFSKSVRHGRLTLKIEIPTT